ncbi:hypothetical protein B0H12DRAFT_1149208 [Mycena haematopus]|nr:hypothetical protein B0H12DRAFT_1152960 [Mycena haematopus]KAJ7226371.1 hypothetical protein B0H12DRAFT_1149208 [Mycena haematopus]
MTPVHRPWTCYQHCERTSKTVDPLCGRDLSPPCAFQAHISLLHLLRLERFLCCRATHSQIEVGILSLK